MSLVTVHTVPGGRWQAGGAVAFLLMSSRSGWLSVVSISHDNWRSMIGCAWGEGSGVAVVEVSVPIACCASWVHGGRGAPFLPKGLLVSPVPRPLLAPGWSPVNYWAVHLPVPLVALEADVLKCAHL